MNAFRRYLSRTTFVLTMVIVSPIRADFLNLRDGTVLEGIFEGASARNMHFRVDGTVREFPLRAIKGLELSPRPEAEALSSLPPASVAPYRLADSDDWQLSRRAPAVN